MCIRDRLCCRGEADRALLEVFAAVNVTANGAEIEVLVGGRIDVVVCPHIVFSVIAFSELCAREDHNSSVVAFFLSQMCIRDRPDVVLLDEPTNALDETGLELSLIHIFGWRKAHSVRSRDLYSVLLVQICPQEV